MKRAASVFLRSDISRDDVKRMTLWLKNEKVTRYLNENARAPYELDGLLRGVPEPLLGCRLSTDGRFFMICAENTGAVGFLKLREYERGGFEIVVVVGDESLWGNGYGRGAVQAALRKAFLEWRAKCVTAKIYHGNVRSIGMLCGCGFREEESFKELSCYRLTMGEYLDAALSGVGRMNDGRVIA